MVTPDICSRKLSVIPSLHLGEGGKVAVKKKDKVKLKEVRPEQSSPDKRAGSITVCRKQPRIIFPMYFPETTGLDVSDIIADKSKTVKRKIQRNDSNNFAGMKNDSLDRTLTRNGDWIYPRKNCSNAFDHLDMSQKTYNNYLMSTT